jgi:hypothetical protein
MKPNQEASKQRVGFKEMGKIFEAPSRNDQTEKWDLNKVEK